MSRALRHQRLCRHALRAAASAIVFVATACGSLPSVPNPFTSVETPTPPPTAAIPGPPDVRVTPTPVRFEPFWVQNHRITEMWNGPTSQSATDGFGATTSQFCSFLAVLPPEGDRLYVFNPYTQNYLWIDAADVGPAGPPEQRSGAKPDGNCSREVYSD